MTLLRRLLLILGVVMISIITFHSFNLIFTVVANHSALDLVTLSGLPLIIFTICLVIGLMVAYRFFLKKHADWHYLRYYSIVIGAMSVVGLGLSIFTGVGIYKSFIKDFVFKCYPLIMTIVFTLMISGSVLLAVFISKKIKAENIEKTHKGSLLYGLREAGLGIVITYALNRFGAFCLFPVYFSSYDTVYVLPYIFQLLVPGFLVVIFLLHEDFLKNRKITFILSCIAFGYSLFSMIYMILMSKGNYPLTINGLTMIQQFERLVCYPISAIIMYALSLIAPLTLGIINGVKLLKEKK